jgi:hypothetical protein
MNSNCRSENTFFTALAVAMALTVFVGFSRTFFLKIFFPEAQELAAPETVFYVHGALFAAWMLLLIIQPSLVRVGCVALHRRLGTFGGVLAASMVVMGMLGAMIAAQRPGGFFGVPLYRFNSWSFRFSTSSCLACSQVWRSPGAGILKPTSG